MIFKDPPWCSCSRKDRLIRCSATWCSNKKVPCIGPTHFKVLFTGGQWPCKVSARTSGPAGIVRWGRLQIICFRPVCAPPPTSFHSKYAHIITLTSRYGTLLYTRIPWYNSSIFSFIPRSWWRNTTTTGHPLIIFLFSVNTGVHTLPTYNILHNIIGDLLRLHVSNKNKKFAAAMTP